MVYYGTAWLTTAQKMGVGLSALGAGFLLMGCLLFFNRGLLTMGNLLFLMGLIFIIGPSKTGAFFFRRTKWRGSLAFSMGILLIFYKHTIVGMAVELLGFLNLFGDFFPYLLMFARKTPVVDPNAGAKCQKCLQAGHWTYDCPNQRAYRPRPTRSALLANPNLRLPEATMPSVDLEKERENAIADILGPQRDAPEKEEKAQESDDSGTTDYESDSDLTTDTEAEATTEENQVSTARSLVHARDDPHEAEVKADSSSGFSSSEDSESETPLKRSKN